jgi:hypothetical protein
MPSFSGARHSAFGGESIAVGYSTRDVRTPRSYRIVEGRMCIWLRYFATVRRAMRMP